MKPKHPTPWFIFCLLLSVKNFQFYLSLSLERILWRGLKEKEREREAGKRSRRLSLSFQSYTSQRLLIPHTRHVDKRHFAIVKLLSCVCNSIAIRKMGGCKYPSYDINLTTRIPDLKALGNRIFRTFFFFLLPHTKPTIHSSLRLQSLQGC